MNTPFTAPTNGSISEVISPQAKNNVVMTAKATRVAAPAGALPPCTVPDEVATIGHPP